MVDMSLGVDVIRILVNIFVISLLGCMMDVSRWVSWLYFVCNGGDVRVSPGADVSFRYGDISAWWL